MIPKILKANKATLEAVEHLGERAFEAMWLESGKTLSKVDAQAELGFQESIAKDFGKDVAVHGEESLGSPIGLSEETRPSVLVDMIDGTDLLERGFSNWCSAVVIFSPRPPTIEGAFVLQRSDIGTDVYFATRRLAHANKREIRIGKSGRSVKIDDIELTGPERAKNRNLRDAAVCIYGQKGDALVSLLELRNEEKFINWLSRNITIDIQRRRRKENPLRFRFYNLAGNPMMARLAEGVVDVVFELQGQYMHDVVPGAYIARKSGASLGNTTGRPIKEQELAEKLLHPTESKISYILAANKKMVKELGKLLSPTRQAPASGRQPKGAHP